MNETATGCEYYIPLPSGVGVEDLILTEGGRDDPLHPGPHAPRSRWTAGSLSSGPGPTTSTTSGTMCSGRNGGKVEDMDPFHFGLRRQVAKINQNYGQFMKKKKKLKNFCFLIHFTFV